VARIAFFLWTAFLAACGHVPASREAASGAEGRYERLLHGSPAELSAFLRDMPKGGDLHNHLSGAIYAESYVAWAEEKGLCVDTASLTLLPAAKRCPKGSAKVAEFAKDNDRYGALIDAFSMRNFTQEPSATNRSGHDHFFATFDKFDPADSGKLGEELAEAMKRAGGQNVLYLELMVSPGMGEARAAGASCKAAYEKRGMDGLYACLRKKDAEMQALVRQIREGQNAGEGRAASLLGCTAFSACPVKVRYLGQVIRVFPPEEVFAQAMLAFELMKSDPRFVGVNFVAPEDDRVTLRDYDAQMETLRYLSEKYENGNIALHAGELALGLVPPEHLRSHIGKAVGIAGARRIGHGVDVFHEDNSEALLDRMRKGRVAVEINLTSNDVILGVSGDAHPFPAYLRHEVPATLSTDDEGVSRIDLTHEYKRAATSYGLSYPEMKMLSRNGLEYAFLPGKSLWEGQGTGTAPERFDPIAACEGDMESALCKESARTSEKASLQRELEIRFTEFEAAYADAKR
jgi:adenosine deaminase